MTHVRRLIAVALVALAVPTVASAHFGGGWFTSAAAMSKNIQTRYVGVSAARCFAPPAGMQAHSYVYADGVRRWDHFVCGIAFTNGKACSAIAHVTGGYWDSFYLSSTSVEGCSPYDLTRR